LTRPSSDNHAWHKGIAATGHQVVDWPLIEIQAVSDKQRLLAVLNDWPLYQAVMFVSRNAVLHTFSVGKPAAGWGSTRCWATGPGTRQALLEAGVPQTLIDAPDEQAGQFDTEALWQVVRPVLLADKLVLILRGSDADQADTALEGVGRDWLMQQLQAAGLPVQTVAVYQRGCPIWDDLQREAARRAASDGSVWVFSSSQALVNLARLLPGQDWSLTKAITTHERIASAARQAGMVQVAICKPVLGHLLASLESLA
jgi:uroporphyrinogen-III synthase